MRLYSPLICRTCSQLWHLWLVSFRKAQNLKRKKRFAKQEKCFFDEAKIQDRHFPFKLWLRPTTAFERLHKNGFSYAKHSNRLADLRFSCLLFFRRLVIKKNGEVRQENRLTSITRSWWRNTRTISGSNEVVKGFKKVFFLFYWSIRKSR